jgi:hypothetical protein
MVKKRLRDGSDCRKCAQATDHLAARGLLERIDLVVWAIEGDAESAGMQLGIRLGIENAPFFVVRDDSGGEQVYTSVMRLIKERLGSEVSSGDEAKSIDPDDIGGI